MMSEAFHRPSVVFGKLAGTGLLLLGLAGLLAAASMFLRVVAESEQQTRAYPTEASPKHDFQLIQLGQFRRDQFLVDKASGRVWQSVCSGNVNGADCDGMLIWDEMYVDGITPSSSTAAVVYRMRSAAPSK
jgi:hypothetical protein